MTDPTEIASRYIETWNALDDGHRRQLLADHWSEDAHYVDPLMSATGGSALSGLIGAVHERFPGFRFALISTPNGHGDWVRFSWGLGPEGSEPLIEGSDVIRMQGGRMKQIIGFLDKVPAQS